MANFLVPVMMDEVNYAEPRMTGNLEMLEGSLIKVLFVSGPNDENIFPLFTDWDEMRAFAPNTPVEGRVMPARDAWKFIARDGLPAVVSPAGMTVDLTVEQVADLASRFDRLPNLSVFG